MLKEDKGFDIKFPVGEMAEASLQENVAIQLDPAKLEENKSIQMMETKFTGLINLAKNSEGVLDFMVKKCDMQFSRNDTGKRRKT